MLLTRMTFGVAAAIATYVPLLALQRFAVDYHFEFFSRFNEYSHPPISELAIPFAPLAWWGLLPPIGIGIAVGASLRLARSPVMCFCILASAVLQAAALFAVFLPYAKLNAVPGVPIYDPYPTAPLIGNIAVLCLSFGWALKAILKLRSEKKMEVEQAKR
ncbi:MAG: hypothetical protein MUF31_10980 [Akkermansiaceae bacterium]|jgi:hypothetical protein|nr:hypothetical protein [Akkermansiaceae bacterium]